MRVLAVTGLTAMLLPGVGGGRDSQTAFAGTSCPAAGYGVHRYAPGTGKTVALTFDDGPGQGTSQLLSVLMRKGVRATFFNVGAEMAARPGIVRDEVRQGHTLGNHTWDHVQLTRLSATDQASEIDRTTAEQLAVAGIAPCVFRPPYGSYNASTLAVAAARGLSVWTWSVDTEDWKASGSTAAYWVHRIVARAEAGVTQDHPVVLFHNASGPGEPATVLALPTVIDFYRAHGYAFVDVLGNRGLAPYAPSGAPAPALARMRSGLHLFVRRSDGHLREYVRWQNQWLPGRDLGAVGRWGVAAAHLNSSTLVLARVTSRGSAEVRSVSDGDAGAWSSIGGSFVGRPAVAVNPSTHVVSVAARTSTGGIRVRQRAGAVWSSWMRLGGAFVTAPSIASTSAGTLVAAVDASGRLWTRTGTTSWGPWRAVAGAGATADPALATSSDSRHLVAVVRSATGGLRLSLGSLTGASWGAWRTLGAVVASGPAASPDRGSFVVAATGTDGTTYVDVAAAGATVTSWSGWRGAA